MHIQHVQAMPMPTPTLQLCIPIRMRLDLDEGEGQIRTVPVINYWDSDFVKSKVLGPCVLMLDSTVCQFVRTFCESKCRYRLTNVLESRPKRVV